MTELPPCRLFVVQGRVQGVGYRWFALRHAEALGLAGWVQNRDDGAVEVIARGPASALESLEAELRRGPSGARVQRVISSVVQHELVEGNSFHIKH